MLKIENVISMNDDFSINNGYENLEIEDKNQKDTEILDFLKKMWTIYDMDIVVASKKKQDKKPSNISELLIRDVIEQNRKDRRK